MGPKSWWMGLERPTGIEPTYLPWEGNALPLSYGRLRLHRGYAPSCGASIPTGRSRSNLRLGEAVPMCRCRVRSRGIAQRTPGWFDKLTTNGGGEVIPPTGVPFTKGGGSLHPFVLSLSKDGALGLSGSGIGAELARSSCANPAPAGATLGIAEKGLESPRRLIFPEYGAEHTHHLAQGGVSLDRLQ